VQLLQPNVSFSERLCAGVVMCEELAAEWHAMLEVLFLAEERVRSYWIMQLVRQQDIWKASCLPQLRGLVLSSWEKSTTSR